MRGWGPSRILRLGLAVAASFAFATGVASAQGTPELKIGIVTFLSGEAAAPFGIPARNGAELIIDALNKGEVPAPYATKGIAGAEIKTVIVDEAGGTTQQVTQYRNLVQRDHVDLVIGYISSGDCLAIAPLADQLKTLTVYFDCGTPRIFEDANYRYLFRTGATATMDNVAAARYLLAADAQAKSIAGINQNYAWGQDSWTDFKASMEALKPGIKVLSEQFPRIGAGQYGAEISALLVANPDILHSSFWGGDLEALVLQGRARGLFAKREVVLTAGEPSMFRLAKEIPDGTIIGARGPFGVFAPPSALNDWFRKAYIARFSTPPTYPAYKITQAILGVKAAYEKAAGAGGKLPSVDQVITAFTGLSFVSPGGEVEMKLGNGHQAIQETAYGRFKFDKATGEPSVSDVKYYPAGCVNPPVGIKSAMWIKQGFPGAKCQ